MRDRTGSPYVDGYAAKWWRREGDDVRCLLCPHACLLPSGGTGRCGVRAHVEGEGLRSLNYGMSSSLAIDPIEKKPLYHWKPGTQTFSLGSVGCTMRCPFCQNWQLAEGAPSVPLLYLAPGEVARAALRHGTPSVAFTYNEPLVWYEFLLDACERLEKEGIPVVLVSNGMLNARPMEELLPHISAANIDLKAFTEEAYRFMGGELKPVMKTIEMLTKAGVHVETTFLLVPGINDDASAFRDMVAWLASLNPAPPLHISRYFPNRVWRKPATQLDLMCEFERIAREYLPWVYRGNVEERSATECKTCGRILVLRDRYRVLEYNVDDGGRCSFCNAPSPIVP